MTLTWETGQQLGVYSFNVIFIEKLLLQEAIATCSHYGLSFSPAKLGKLVRV